MILSVRVYNGVLYFLRFLLYSKITKLRKSIMEIEMCFIENFLVAREHIV